MIVLDISAGENYYISVRHDTDSYYTEAEKTILNNTKFSVNVTSQTTNNRTVNITAKSNIPDEVIDGKLLFIVPNSDPINATYAGNGTWWAVYTFDDYGVYEVNATYTGLDNVTINNATITVNKADSTLTVGDIVFDYGGSSSTAVSFTGASGVNASVVGYPEAVVTVENNTITVSGLNVGTYILTVTTIADADHNNVTKNVTITVNKIKTQLTAKAVTTTYQINKNLVITLKDSTGKVLSGVKVTVDLNGIKTYTTDKNGQVKINVAKLVPKTYTAKVTFKGNAHYAKSSVNVKVTVNKVTTKITVKSVKTTYKVNKKLVIALKDSTGKALSGVKVNVKLKGTKTYTTNKKGQIKINVAKLVPKTYTAKVTFKGNAHYAKSSVNTKVTVKKAKPKIKAKNKAYKAANKNKKFKITLKDNKGKPIKKAKVRLIVKKIKKNAKKKTTKESKKNKRKNIVKTNKKGKATFKVQRNKKGKYMATVKFYKNKYYTKAVKKVKIKMK